MVMIEMVISRPCLFPGGQAALPVGALFNAATSLPHSDHFDQNNDHVAMMMMIMFVMIMLPVTLSAWLHRSQPWQALPGPQARSLDIPAWKYGKITRWIVLLIMDIMASGSCMLCVSRVLRVEFSCVEWVPVPAACVAWFYPVTQWIIYCPQTCQKQILELGSDWSPTDLFNRMQGGAANAVVGGKPDQHHLQKVEFIQHSVGKIYVFKREVETICFFLQKICQKNIHWRTSVVPAIWSANPVLPAPSLPVLS